MSPAQRGDDTIRKIRSRRDEFGGSKPSKSPGSLIRRLTSRRNDENWNSWIQLTNLNKIVDHQ
jgi:hypothetical protein